MICEHQTGGSNIFDGEADTLEHCDFIAASAARVGTADQVCEVGLDIIVTDYSVVQRLRKVAREDRVATGIDEDSGPTGHVVVGFAHMWRERPHEINVGAVL